MAAETGFVGDVPAWITRFADDENYEWARRAWRVASEQPGAWFDRAKADAVVALWPKVFRLTNDRFAGVSFRLNGWQEIIVRLLVGWKVPEEVLDPATGEPITVHVRLFRRMMLWVPRKNGKSEFLAALALLFWALEGTVGGEGYVFARDEDQAKISFEKMKDMIAYSSELAVDIQTHRKSLYLKPSRALFSLLTGAEDGKHGKSPTVILGDEMHEWRSRVIENTLRQGTGARLQPIELYASTAGLKSNVVGVELWDESLAILDGRVDDPTTLVVLFAAPEDADWQDEETWAKANPSLGLSPTLSFLRREAALAVDNPRAEAHFRCYHLNQWIEAFVRWLNMKKWDACCTDKRAWRRRFDEMEGRKAFVAADAGAVNDFFALTYLFPPEGADKTWSLACRFWIPEGGFEERVKTNRRVPLQKWVDEGALELTPGNMVDQNFVMKALDDGASRFDLQGIGYDSWNAVKMVTDMQAAGVDPDLFVEVRQGIRTLGEPTKMFERLVIGGLLDHGQHPVLRWMAGNATVRFDENLNYAPAKKRSADKIDGIVAAVMALAVAIPAEEMQSFWEAAA